MVIEEGKKCINFSKCLKYELKQMVNWVNRKKKITLIIPQVHHYLAVGVNIGRDSTLGDGMCSSPNSTSIFEHFLFCFGKP